MLNMKKALALLASLLLLCSLVPVGALLAANADDNNIVVNGDFENGSNGWNMSSYATIVDTAHAGNGALKLENPSAWGEAATQIVNVDSNTEYTVIWYSKRVSGTGAFDLFIMNNNGYANLDREGPNWMNETSGNWVKNQCVVKTGTATQVMLKFSCEVPNAGVILVDDLTMVKKGGSTPEPDLPGSDTVLSLDFNDGSVNGFSGGASVVADGPDGSNCLKWTAAGNWGCTEKAGVIVKPNTDYTATFMVKASVAGSMGITIQNGDWGAWLNCPAFAVTTEWKKVVYTFNTATYPNASGAILFKFQDVGQAMDLYIDDLVIVEGTGTPDEPDNPPEVTVANGDFETGDETGWQIHQSTAIEAGAAHDGSYGAHLKGVGGWGGMLNQAITVTAGSSYELTFWIKVNANGVNMQLKDGGETGSNLVGDWFDVSGAGDWTEKKYIVTPTTEVLFINFCGAGNGTAEDAYVDSFTITELKEASFDGYITNGDFETGKIDGWENLWGSCSVEIVGGRNGGSALKLSCNQWQLFRQIVEVEPNTDYVVHAYSKDAANMALIAKTCPADQNIPGANVSFASGSGWSKTTMEFNSGNTNQIYLALMGADNGATGIFDDFAMYKKGDEPGGDDPDQPIDPAYPTELVNGDFEKGEEGWTLAASASIVSDNTHKGTGALKIENPSLWSEAVVQAVSVQKDTNYVITWYSKRVSGAGSFNLILMNDADHNYSVVSGQNWMNETSGDWVKNEVIINTGSQNVIKFKFTSEVNDAGVILIDDVQMIIEGSEPVDPTASLIKNGSFEDGKDDWSWGGESAVADDPYEGSHSAKLVNNSAWGVGIEQVVKVEKNTDYVLRFYTKRVTGAGVWVLSLMDNDTVNVTNVNIEATSGQKWFSHTTTNKWEEHIIEFNSGEVTKVLVKFGPEADNAGSFLVDYIGMWTKGNEPSPDNPDNPDNPVVPPKAQMFMTSFGVLNNRPISNEDNLLTNASFEKSGGQWKEGFTGETVSVVKDSTTLFGSKSLYFNTAGIKEETKMIFWLDLAPETDYVFSTWLKGAFLADDNSGLATIGIVDENGRFLAQYVESDIKRFLNGKRQIVPTAWDNEWHIRGIEFNTGECTKVGIALAGTNSQMWIDDMALFEVGQGKKYMSANAAGNVSLSYDIDSNAIACKDKDSLIPDPTFSKGTNDFWKSSYGWKNGFLSVVGNKYEYGKSLKYTYSKDTAPLSVIKTIEVEPNTDYTFVVDLKILEDGWGKLMLCDGKKREPVSFLEVSFDSYDYDPEASYYGWYTTVCKFNTDVYDKISLVILNDGGQALLDNMRLFKSEKGIKNTDAFTPPPEEPTPDVPPSDNNWWTDYPVIDDPVIDDPLQGGTDDPYVEDEPIEAPSKPIKLVPTVAKTDNSAWLWVGIGGGILLLAGASAFLFFFLKKKKSTPPAAE